MANCNPSLVTSEDLYINLVHMAHVRQAAFCTRVRLNLGTLQPKKDGTITVRYGRRKTPLIRFDKVENSVFYYLGKFRKFVQFTYLDESVQNLAFDLYICHARPLPLLISGQ